MTMNADGLDAAKRALRKRSGAARDELDDAFRATAAARLPQFAVQLTRLLPAQGIVSSYRAMGSEIDPLALEGELRRLGWTTGLPVIVRMGAPLIFRHWAPGQHLTPRKWGILEPDDGAGEVVPDLLLVPLLAFDAEGWRLGYGGGFYDRTLERLKSVKGALAIGVGFCEQEVDAVPRDAYDQKLDYVLTPAGLRSFEGSDQ